MQRRALELAGPNGSVDALAQVTRAGAVFRLVLRLKTPAAEGERSLEAESCDVLAESVALVVAMSATPVPEPIAQAPAAPPEPPFRTAAIDATSAEASAGHRIRLFSYGALDIGTLPKLAVGGGAGASVTLPRGVSVAILAAAWAPNSGELPHDAKQGARFQAWTAQASATYPLARGDFEVSARALVEVARASATGVGADRVEETSATWWSLGVGVVARWQGGAHLGVVFGCDAVVPTSQQTFVIVDGGTVHRVSAVTARAYAGPEVRF